MAVTFAGASAGGLLAASPFGPHKRTETLGEREAEHLVISYSNKYCFGNDIYCTLLCHPQEFFQ